MTKVFLQPGLRGLSGGMGDWVYQRRKGKTYVGMKPTPTTKEPTEAQVIQRERFGEAAQYAKMTLDDPARREFYEMVAEEMDLPVSAVVVKDFLSVPSFKALDLSGYQGRVGDAIQIRALQEIGLASVNVELLASDETVLEQGRAFEKSARTGYWIYMGQSAQPLGSQLTIRVSGVDHTGKKAEITETVVMGEQA
jgi:hypothetical protein